MLRPRDVLVIAGQERFAGAVYLGSSNMYRWADVVLDGANRWYVVHFTQKLTPQDIGLRRGHRLPDYISYEGDQYMLQSDGQSTTQRIDRREPALTAHFADIVSGTNHIGIQIYDVTGPFYAGEAEIWHGHEIDIEDITLLPIDTDKKREGALTQQQYHPLPAPGKRKWWQRSLPE